MTIDTQKGYESEGRGSIQDLGAAEKLIRGGEGWTDPGQRREAQEGREGGQWRVWKLEEGRKEEGCREWCQESV